MKAVYGMVRQVKKQLTTDLAIIEVEINKKDYKAAVELLDDQPVLLTIAQNIPGGYGVLEAKPDPPKRSFEELPPSQQAAIRCKDEGFRHWIGATSEDDCVLMVRERCGIDSRRELDTSAEAQDKWVMLNNAFWAETRGYQEEGQ